MVPVLFALTNYQHQHSGNLRSRFSGIIDSTAKHQVFVITARHFLMAAARQVLLVDDDATAGIFKKTA